MELNHLNKLSEKTTEDLINCELKIENWLKFRNDYKALEERLSTITDKTTHDIMVPIGGSNLAFMPGFIKHTNEILVLLGDNYFVERSAKQAIDIVNRRLTNCDKMIHNLNEEKSQLQKWLSFSQQFSAENQDLVEIVEEYDEQKEKLWREEHRRNVRAYKQRLAQEKQTNNQLSDDLNEKLQNLEIQENQENQTQVTDLKSILKKDSHKSEKSVSFDKCEESVLITNEEESYPLPKFDQKMIKSELKSEMNVSESEVAFKSNVTEKVMTETVPNIDNPERIVSRFRANRLKK